MPPVLKPEEQMVLLLTEIRDLLAQINARGGDRNEVFHYFAELFREHIGSDVPPPQLP